MANFNPQVPETPPTNFMSWSKPIDQPMANKSGEHLFKAIGDLVENVATTADTFVKNRIDAQVYDNVDNIRDSFTEQLQAVKDSTNTPKAATAQPVGAKSLLFDATSVAANAEAPALPTELQRVDQLPSVLKGALDLKGNDFKTYYDMQLNTYAKGLRAQYPGYRDYIDHKISQVTGENPANALVSSLIAGINSQGSETKKEIEHIDGMFRTAIHEGVVVDKTTANSMRTAWKNGQITNEAALGFLNRANAFKYQKAVLDAKTDATKIGRAEDAIVAERSAHLTLGQSANTIFDAVYTIAGLDKPATITKIAEDLAAGNLRVGDDQARELTQQLAAKRDAWIRDANAKLDEVDPKTGLSLRNRMGDTAAKAVIADKKTMFDLMEDRFKNHDYGFANNMKKTAENILDNTLANALSDPKVGPALTKIHTITKLAGPYGAVLSQSLLGTDLPENVQKWVTDAYKLSWGQPERPKGKITTAAEVIQDGLDKGIQDPKAFSKIINNINFMTDQRSEKADPQLRKNIADFFFSVGNNPMLSKLTEDHWDEKRQMVIPGRYHAYLTLTNPKVVDTIKKMATDDPNYTQKLKNWTETSFFDLFGTQIKNLESIQNNQSLHLKWTADEVGHRFELVDDRGRPLGGPKSSFENQTISKLNMALQGLTNVEKGLGHDTGAYVLQVLRSSGVDLSKNINGIPDKMVKAILAAKGPQPVEKPRGERIRKAVDDAIDTVDQAGQNFVVRTVPDALATFGQRFNPLAGSQVLDPFNTKTKKPDQDRVINKPIPVVQPE